MKNKHYKLFSLIALLSCLTLLLSASKAQRANSVWTRGYDNSRTYANLNEPILNVTNVNSRQFGKLFSRKVQGHVYAQVLYVPNVLMQKDNKKHNAIFVATMSNNVYAFDADDAEQSEPLWFANFGNPLPLDDNPVGQNCGVFQDIFMEIGIVSTPVIDVDSQTIYFVTTLKDSDTGEFQHKLHAVDITCGEHRTNSPILISGSVQGTGSGSVDGVVEFMSSKQLQRMGLSLIDGTVYVGFGGYCFTPPYHGWLFGFDSVSLERKFLFCSTPNGLGGGIWQGSTGISSDNKYIYLATANGDWNGETEWSSSFLKIDPKNVETEGNYKGLLKGITSYFTPYNQEYLGTVDLDVGATGVLLIPDSDVMMGCTKFGRCYLVDRTDLGGHSGESNTNIQDFKPNPELPEAFGFGVHSSPVTWVSKTKGRLIYVWGAQDSLRALHFTSDGSKGAIDISQSEVVQNQQNIPEFPGGMMSLSALDFNEGSGIVWSYQPETGNSNHEIRPGMVRAFDANDINRELWNSAMNRDRDYPGNYAKWQPPTIANGKVYVGTFSMPPSKESEVVAYGLLNIEPNVTTSCSHCESVGVPEPLPTSSHEFSGVSKAFSWSTLIKCLMLSALLSIFIK